MIARTSLGTFAKGTTPQNKIIIPEQTLREMYTKYGAYKISKQLGISKQTVFRNLKEYNIETRQGGAPKRMPVYWKIALRKPKSVPSYLKGKTKNDTPSLAAASEKLSGPKSLNWKPEIHADEKVLCACGCGEFINKFDRRGRERFYAKGHCAKGHFKSEDVSGEKGCKWKGGITPVNDKIRHGKKYDLWRKAIYLRDNYTCKECGKQYIGIIAHHIKAFADYPELRFDIDNGVTLCRSCHLKLHQANKGRGGCKPAKGGRKGK